MNGKFAPVSIGAQKNIPTTPSAIATIHKPPTRMNAFFAPFLSAKTPMKYEKATAETVDITMNIIPKDSDIRKPSRTSGNIYITITFAASTKRKYPIIKINISL